MCLLEKEGGRTDTKMDDYKRQGLWKYLTHGHQRQLLSPSRAPRVRTAKMQGEEDKRGLSCCLEGVSLLCP